MDFFTPFAAFYVLKTLNAGEEERCMDKNRRIKIIPGFSGYKPRTVCFKTGMTSEDVYNFEQFAFEDGPGLVSPSAIRLLYERMILGSPFPNTFIINRVESFQNILAAALFIDPSLVYEERCCSLVYSLDLMARVGDVGSAHIPQAHSRLMSDVSHALESMSGETAKDDYNRLHSAASLMSEFIRHGSLGFGAGEKDIKGVRSFEKLFEQDDFVVVSTDHNRSIFESVYREGFLCGVWFPEDESKPVLFKKSSLVPYLNLSKVAQLLDKQEFGVSVSSAGWMQNFDPAMVGFPRKDPTDGTECDGTSLSSENIIEVVRGVYEKERSSL